MVLANGAGDESVLLLSERLNETGLKMEKEKVMRIMHILGEEVSTHEDITFVRNNLEDFNKFLFNVTTQELVEDGVAPDKVEMLLKPLVEVARMWGASSFADFTTLEGMFE